MAGGTTDRLPGCLPSLPRQIENEDSSIKNGVLSKTPQRTTEGGFLVAFAALLQIPRLTDFLLNTADEIGAVIQPWIAISRGK